MGAVVIVFFGSVILAAIVGAILLFVRAMRQYQMQVPPVPPGVSRTGPGYRHDMNTVRYLNRREQTTFQGTATPVESDPRKEPLARCASCGAAIGFKDERCHRCGSPVAG